MTNNKRKWLLRLHQKGEGKVSHFMVCHTLSDFLGPQQEPNLADTFYVERVNLISSPQGKATRKRSPGRHKREILEQANAIL